MTKLLKTFLRFCDWFNFGTDYDWPEETHDLKPGINVYPRMKPKPAFTTFLKAAILIISYIVCFILCLTDIKWLKPFLAIYAIFSYLYMFGAIWQDKGSYVGKDLIDELEKPYKELKDI